MNTLSMKKTALYCSMAAFAALLIHVGTNFFVSRVPIFIIHILIITAVIYKVRESKLWKHLLYSALLTIVLFYALISGSLSLVEAAYVNVIIVVISCTPLFALYFKNKEYKNEILIVAIVSISGSVFNYFIVRFSDYSDYSKNLGLYVMFAFLTYLLYISSKETEDKNTKYASFAGIIGIALFFVFGIVNIIYQYCDKPEYYDSIYHVLDYEEKAQYPTFVFASKLIDIQQYILPLASIALASFFFVLLKRSGWSLKKECVPIIISTLSLFFLIQQRIYVPTYTFLAAIFAMFSYSFYKLYQKL